ncbi:hypothetical protein [Sulfuriflexus sp.]|uniref:hypothetical protein n=1 Tax=Sulfuriflexus sp. TaxID=2015443 RepID=UPI0028CFA08D|nr:hypothetical protein [Sulfuriflexus sp.]MDT8403105.1 hypothetical protein [Sulfuriflexus sp.]
MNIYRSMLLGVLCIGISACASTSQNTAAENKLASSCEKGIEIAYKELDFAKTTGFGGSWEYTKAASLLGTAKVQSGFGAYAGCIDKVSTARAYIEESKK